MPEASVAKAEPKSVAEAIAPTADPLKPRPANRTGNKTLTKPSPKPRKVRAERMMPASRVAPDGNAKRPARASQDRGPSLVTSFKSAASWPRLEIFHSVTE